jgi:hypothetical protein
MASICYNYPSNSYAASTNSLCELIIQYADVTSATSNSSYRKYVPSLASIIYKKSDWGCEYEKYPNLWYEDSDTCGTDCHWRTWGSSAAPVVAPSASDRLREMIRLRQTPVIVVRRNAVKQAERENELRARSTLRRVIGEDQYRRFMKNGFIVVRGQSGKTYQIFPGYNKTVVWENGKKIEELCVVLSGDFPPTDSMIMRYLMILNDENDFRQRANVFRPYTSSVAARIDPNRSVPLPELFRKMKAA